MTLYHEQGVQIQKQRVFLKCPSSLYLRPRFHLLHRPRSTFSAKKAANNGVHIFGITDYNLLASHMTCQTVPYVQMVGGHSLDCYTGSKFQARGDFCVKFMDHGQPKGPIGSVVTLNVKL